MVTASPGTAVNGSLAPEARREAPLAALAGLPLPSRRQEDWRFTELDPLLAVESRRLEAPAPADLPAARGSVRLWLDGRSDPLAGVRLPEGVVPLSAEERDAALGATLAATACQDHWPVALNAAAAAPVLALRITQAVAPVLELVSDAAGAAGVLPLRLLLLLDPQASLQLLQVHRSSGTNLTSIVVETRLAPGARLTHGLLARGGDRSCLLGHLAVSQEPGSELSLVTATAGWGLSRLEPRVVQAAGDAVTRLRGLQRVEGRQIADTHSQVCFAGPDGRLDQLHKVVAGGAGRSVFNGAVRVPRPAQRTDAAQLSRSLLLSERARVDTKPELEIVADDVRCAHGATVSRLQQDELFYLRSRGVSADDAARLLVRGYCEEVLAELPAAAAAWQPLQTLLGPEVPAP